MTCSEVVSDSEGEEIVVSVAFTELVVVETAGGPDSVGVDVGGAVVDKYSVIAHVAVRK